MEGPEKANQQQHFPSTSPLRFKLTNTLGGSVSRDFEARGPSSLPFTTTSSSYHPQHEAPPITHSETFINLDAGPLADSRPRGAKGENGSSTLFVLHHGYM